MHCLVGLYSSTDGTYDRLRVLAESRGDRLVKDVNLLRYGLVITGVWAKSWALRDMDTPGPLAGAGF